MFRRNILISLTALLIVISVAAPSEASSWTKLKSDNEDKVFHINIADVKLRGAMATYWYKSENKQHMTSKVRGSINCETDESLILKVIYYNSDGKVRFSTRVSSPWWKAITPGSLMSRHRDVLCEDGKVRSRKDFQILTGNNKSDWISLSEDAGEAGSKVSDDEKKQYLNLKNVVEKDNLVTCWNRFSNSDNSFTLNKLALDCHKGKLKKLDQIKFDSNGEPVWDTVDSEWEGPSFSPEIGILLDELCPENLPAD